MPNESAEIDHTFNGTIGVDVKGEIWTCVEIPDSAALFGSLRSIRVDATIDGIQLLNTGLMPTGTGELMLSLNAKLRKQLNKGIGDVVTVRVQSRQM
ncbi:DUF1905 domain-containing protein [Microbacterium lushaniae]|uniref:DUF1905 domain-containing protein n=1 Tax=Microbacterium lushaniae TaxID=2614639 RepID=A0A5J6L2P1_9MICO|nr:DUF1905 domain-containing protein [Microbacterium lushaniae]QEW02737.1 DUF1905 domain-containing protein [Microbacterium lushaniae]